MATMSHTKVVTFQIIFKDVQFLEKQTATLEIVNIGQVGNLFESSRFVPQQTSLLWPYSKFFVCQACSVEMAKYWPRSGPPCSCTWENIPSFVWKNQSFVILTTWRTSLLEKKVFSCVYFSSFPKYWNSPAYWIPPSNSPQRRGCRQR